MWSFVPRSSNTNVVDCKWVYKLKLDKNGAITRYKARFVSKGFRQQPGINFHESFSLVVKSTTIRAVLSLAITNNWPLRQLDVQNAFLHGNLKEKVYMKQPPGFIDPQRPNHVCQYMHALTENHWSAVKRILCYLYGTVRSSGSTLQAFTDVLWKGGFAIYLGSKLISWIARKQRTISCSSTEAGYKALANTITELTWLQALLHKHDIHSSSTPIL
ncbi:gag/pol polyprotein [Tanacetum coccineum]